MSNNMLDLMKTIVLSVAPVLLMWVKMTVTERQKEKIRLKEKEEADKLAAAQRKADEAKQAAIAAAVKQVAVEASKATEKVEQVAVKLDETKTETNQKLDSIAEVADKVHILTNNNMQIQLELNKLVSDRLAVADPTQENLDGAAKADRDLKDHIAKQKKVDAKEEKS